MKLFKTKRGPLVEDGSAHYLLHGADWDALVRSRGLHGVLAAEIGKTEPLQSAPALDDLLAPIGHQEVWAAGVTYFKSRDARMEESKDAGGGDFYARVYDAPRPELFFKGTPSRVVGPGQPVRIRRDSRWNVPEPELTLLVSAAGTIEGYTVGNDMSSRDIEGENPLYLPQAKVYDGSCALGPGIRVAEGPLTPETAIALEITRGGKIAFSGRTTLAQLKRRPDELVEWLFRDQSFPDGCFLLTGTGIVPGGDFTLEAGDVVSIEIDGIGRLVNPVKTSGA
jgi:2-dehydro-3-deoxy-D-arabinonate dehydratase